jgi:uncharacterized protein (DUF2235 family)
MTNGGRNLIVLSDGTGNSAAASSKTNVWRLYQALDLTDGTQIAVFGDGVGTSSITILRILGLALGIGVKRNVLNLYKFLCRNYKDGDHIWAFGFSRGAFTIRVLVGLISHEGLISCDTEAELDRNALAAYRAYRDRGKGFKTRLPWVVALRYIRDKLIILWGEIKGAKTFREVQQTTKEKKRNKIKVDFVGVWDTVAAYGLPIAELTYAVDQWVWPMAFRDVTLLANVKNARQALSLEDDRKTFFPIPWDEAKTVQPERMLQVWFPGAHADVGGGYPDDGLSFVSLCWMIGEAASKGLRFMPSIVDNFAALATPTGRIYDPRSGFGAFYRYQPRDVQKLMGQGVTPVVHGSVMTRIVSGTEGYAPISLPQNIAVLPPFGPQIVSVADVANELEEANLGANRNLSPEELASYRHVLKDTLQVLTDIGKIQDRSARFDLVQDTVWWRRVVYFFSLLLFLSTIIYPYVPLAPLASRLNSWVPLTEPYNPILAFISADYELAPPPEVTHLVSLFMPWFVAPFIDPVANHLAGTFAFAFLLYVSLRFSGSLQGRIRDRARCLVCRNAGEPP